MTDAPHHPPRFVRGVLALVLGLRGGEYVLREMDELFARRVRKDGQASARRWYRRQAVGFLWRWRASGRARPRAVDAPGGEGTRGMGRQGGGGELSTDLHHAVRVLVRRPMPAAASVVVLALAMGATTAVFSLLTGVTSPLPFHEPDRLVRLWESNLPRGIARFSVSAPNAQDWARAGSVEEVAAYDRDGVATLQTNDAPPRAVVLARVQPELFRVLGVEAGVGRLLASDDAERTLVLSHALWTAAFGADPGVVGRTVTLDGEPYEVVGVAASSFGIPNSVAEAWAPLPHVPMMEDRSAHFLRVLARLSPGATPETARSELAGIARRLAEAYPASNHNWSVTMDPLLDTVVDQGFRRGLWVLLGVVALVLLMACANVATLSIARATARARELMVRSALGGAPRRLVRQLFLEGVLVAGVAGTLGVAVAAGLIELARRSGPIGIPRLDEVGIDVRVLAFAAVVAVVASVLFGLLPSLNLVRRSAGPLRAGDRGGSAPLPARGRDALVIGQVAISMVLLVGALLLVQTLRELGRVELGFRYDDVLATRVSLPESGYGEAGSGAVGAFYDELLARLAALPGVTAVGATTGLPFADPNTANLFAPADRPAPPRGEAPDGDLRIVTPGYFDALGIPLLQGRVFDGEVPDGERVVVIGRATAEALWPGRNAVGQQLRVGDLVGGPLFTVIGVVGDVRHYGLTSAAPRPLIFFSRTQNPTRDLSLAVRTTGDAPGVATRVREVVAELDPSLPTPDVVPMERVLAQVLAQPRFQALALAGFAGAAVLLAAVGLYGLIAFLVASRVREMALRIAIGARPASLARRVLLRGTALAVTGALLGAAAGSALTRVLQTLLYRTSPRDPESFLVAGAFLVAVAALACWIPARRAAAVDPCVALREG